MSVEEIMKVNKMAQEFLNQGICNSRDEAVKKAQEMVNNEIAGNDLKKEETEEKQNIAVQGDNMDKLKNMMERMKEATERKFEAYKSALLGLEKEVVSLRSEIKRLNQAAKAAAERPAVQENNKPAEDQAVKNSENSNIPGNSDEQKNEEKDPHPRMGNHKGKDVSIEKMFYYGNNR